MDERPDFLTNEQWQTHQKWLEEEKKKPTLRPVDKTGWITEPPPSQEWTVLDRFPRREVTLFTGEGGAGKSTIGLHLAAAHACGKDWLGSMPEPGASMFVDAEDDENVIRRRLWHIGRHFRLTRDDELADLQIFSLHGKACALAGVSRTAILEPTKLFDELVAAARLLQPQTIVLASSANFFPGNENDRAQVTQFVGLMNYLAGEANGSVVLIAHPSLTGIKDNSGLSGSTQWHNAVRARMYLLSAKANGSKDLDPNLKQLQFLKNQYGPIATTITLRWRDGLFLPEPEEGSFDKAVRSSQVQNELAHMAGVVPYPLSPNKNAANYAPRILARQPEAIALHCTEREIETAIDALLRAGRLWIVEEGPPSKRRQRLTAQNPNLQ